MSTGARRGARVLVVEDHPDTARLLTTVLGAAGFDARAWHRAESVADVLVAESVAALVVSFSGRGIAATTELVAALRARPEELVAGAAIVALVDDEVDLRFGLADAADAVLVRPVPADQLVNAVTEAAATSAAARQLRRPASDAAAQVAG
jgi:DNA-binding response OmpR family regulator